jgi:hypothetical protein
VGAAQRGWHKTKFDPSPANANADRRLELHMGLSTGCRLPAPASFSAGRGGFRCASFRAHYALVLCFV